MRARRSESTAAALRQEIASGRFANRDSLPGERDLAQMFGVSRTTLRQAVAALVSEGVLVQRQGMGTFLAGPVRPAVQSGNTTTRPVVDTGLVGVITESVELGRGYFPATADEAVALGLGPNQEVCRLVRLVRLGETPVGIDRTAAAARSLPDLSWSAPFLAGALAERGIVPVRKVQRLRAAILDRADAERLEAAPGAPAMELHEAAFLDGGQCCAFTRALYRADRVDAVFASDLFRAG